MKLPLANRSRAFSLIECLVYLVLFVFVVGLALETYYVMSQQTRGVTSNASDISRALQAGERWRADVRHAGTSPVMESEAVVLIAQSAGPVRFVFRDGAIWRQTGNAQPQLFLDRVRRSTMHLDQRGTVTACRWELELQTRKAEASVLPLFTFTAVPQTEVSR